MKQDIVTRAKDLTEEMMGELNETFCLSFTMQGRSQFDESTRVMLLSFCLGYLAAKGLRNDEFEIGSVYVGKSGTHGCVEVLNRADKSILAVGWFGIQKDSLTFGTCVSERPISFYGLNTIAEINEALKMAGYDQI